MKKSIESNAFGVIKALSSKNRFLIVKALYKKPLHVQKLLKILKIESSLLSHHLAALRKAGIVESERDGKSVLYKISSKGYNLDWLSLSYYDASYR